MLTKRTENLADNLARTAAQHPQRSALWLGGDALTYEQLDDAAARLAALLRQRGVRPGDRVGVMLPNVPEFAIAYYGALRAGAVVVPMNPLLKEREVAFYLADSGAQVVFGWPEMAESVRAGAQAAGAECIVVGPHGSFAELLADQAPLKDVAERKPEDVAVLLYTSGTTGTPKGAQLTHSNLAVNADVSRRLFAVGTEDVILGALPLFHAFGQTCGLNVVVSVGASLALVPRFDPDAVLETITQRGVTVFEGVPTMYAALLHHPSRERFDVSTLRICVSGGAALAPEILHAFESAFGCAVLEGYGLSETSPVACFNHPDRERKPGSIGTPVEGVQMRLVDDKRREVGPGERGEVAIRGHNVMQGYWNRPEATAETIDSDGWFYTGDIGRVDADGYFFIVDRKKELIIRGGYNVYPRELEEVLYEHPAVREVAVLGIPHSELGEEVAAAVALKPGAGADADELRQFVKERVAAYKYPRYVWLVDELPKTSTGKILKRQIAAPDSITAGGQS
ncbi:MAG TPA: long-chain fatty acid--CoA ligase [Solirubrobacteraceae bacterium]|nr:long-chain fatty acid--CoA ligase [Solirubrobacteraceae bacterium]